MPTAIIPGQATISCPLDHGDRPCILLPAWFSISYSKDIEIIASQGLGPSLKHLLLNPVVDITPGTWQVLKNVVNE